MKIVVDLQCAQSASGLRGIGRYARELTKAMILAAPEDDFVLALNGLLPARIEEIRWFFKDVLPQTNIRVFELPSGVAFHDGNRDRMAAAETMREYFISELRPDIVHLASIMDGGYWEPVVSSIGRIPKTAPVAVTLFDLIPLSFPDAYLYDPGIKEQYLQRLAQLAKADTLLSISRHSAEEGRRNLVGFAGEIATIPAAIDPRFCPGNPRESEARLDKFNITKPFILYVAGFDFRKNHEGLLRSLALLPDSVRNQYQVVLVGGAPDSVYGHFRSVARNCKLPESFLIFAGQVSDHELIDLYRACRLFVFPSLAEGLGLPVLEAMACGAPMISSNASCLPEFLPDPAMGFNPRSPEAMAAKIAECLLDVDRLAHFREIGVEFTKRFTWETSAKVAMNALRKTVGRWKSGMGPVRNRPAKTLHTAGRAIADLRLPAPDIREAAYCLAKNETRLPQSAESLAPRKVGWVTTWGKRCGIACYAKNIVEHLVSAPIILAQKDPLPATAWGQSRPCWKSSDTDDLRELGMMIAASDLDEVMFQFNYGFFEFKALSRLIHELRDKNVAVYLTMHSTSDPAGGRKGLQLRLLSDALARANAVFVHTVADIGRMAAIGVTDNVRLLPHGIRNYGFSARPAKSAAVPRRIATYGFFLPAKGFPEIIEALALMRDDGVDVELVMVNANYGDPGNISSDLIRACRNRVSKLGLDDKVEFLTEFLDDAKSLEHLRTADLVVFPYRGNNESSSAAVRTGLSSHVPVAVTPVGVFADVIEAVHQLPGVSPREIATGIMDLLRAMDNGDSAFLKTEEIAAKLRVANDFSNIARFLEESMASASGVAPAAVATAERNLFIDVSSLVRHDHRTGIQRVVRSVLHALLLRPPVGRAIVPVYISGNNQGYLRAERFAASLMGKPAPENAQDAPIQFMPGDLFLGLDFTIDLLDAYAPHLLRMRKAGVEVQFVVYDLLCFAIPECFEPWLVEMYKKWFNFIANNADGVVCISKAVADEAGAWMAKHYPSRAGQFGVNWFHLGADIENSLPTRGLPPEAGELLGRMGERPSFLMVGRLESRKCQAQALSAFEQLWSKGVDANLVLVGQQGWDAAALAVAIASHPESGKRLHWIRGATDEYLEKIYAASTAIIGASLDEGYGLPLIEAAWHHCPVIARDIPVFREVAGANAFYFSGRDPEDLSSAIEEWLKAYGEGRHPKPDGIKVLNWAQSASQLLAAVHAVRITAERG